MDDSELGFQARVAHPRTTAISGGLALAAAQCSTVVDIVKDIVENVHDDNKNEQEIDDADVKAYLPSCC
jgi:hypothetical protein